MKRPQLKFIFALTLTAAIILLSSCSHEGLVTEKVDPSLYELRIFSSDSTLGSNTKFIVYGDHRPGWRLYERFIQESNWKTRRWIIFPVHLPVLLGNGFWGMINYFRYVPDYGNAERRLVLSEIYNETLTQNIEFVAHTGDIVQNGNHPLQWDKFLRETKIEIPLLNALPFYPVPGNHDQANNKNYGAHNYDAVFPGARFYVKRLPNAVLIFLDTSILHDKDNNLGSYAVRDSLFREYYVSSEKNSKKSWLERQLTDAAGKFKIIVMHHPPFSFGHHSGAWDKDGADSETYRWRDELLTLLKNEEVELILAGHEHYYEHSLLSYVHNGNDKQMNIVITGGGGTPLRELSSLEEVENIGSRFRSQGHTVEMISRSESYNYCIVELRDDKIFIQVKKVHTDEKRGAELIDEIVIK